MNKGIDSAIMVIKMLGSSKWKGSVIMIYQKFMGRYIGSTKNSAGRGEGIHDPVRDPTSPSFFISLRRV